MTDKLTEAIEHLVKAIRALREYNREVQARPWLAENDSERIERLAEGLAGLSGLVRTIPRRARELAARRLAGLEEPDRDPVIEATARRIAGVKGS
jgi:Sec-independent protein translocase protein TatA